MDYVKAWMYSLINEKEISTYVRRILLNLLNAELPEFVKPSWLPSKREIKDLLKLENKIAIDVKFFTGTLQTKTFTLPHTCTVQQLMEQIYALPQLAQIIDRF